MDPIVEESVEEAFRKQADLIAYYLGLEVSEVEECLRNPSSPKCRVVWRVAHDQFLTLTEDDQWTLALELDFATLENLCKISLIMRRFCTDEIFWKAKFRRDLGRDLKYHDHEKELWKQNYALAFTHSVEPIQDLRFLEIMLMAENHGMTPPTLKELVHTFRFYELVRFRESMLPIAFTAEEEIIQVENTVISLNLADETVLQLLPEIGYLRNLQRLHLYENQLTTLPPEITSLSSLQQLNLSENQLTTLPPQIGALSSLQILEFSSNQLTTLPPQITSLSSLQILYLSDNRLTTLPPEIGNLSSLQQLHLASNELTTLPPEIGNLSSLQTLVLFRNRLTTLPPEIGNLSSLQTLHLEGNHLTTLPPEITTLSSLLELYLKDNHLTTLPPEIGSLSSLLELYLNNNRLTTLPLEIGLLPNLQELDLRGNPIDIEDLPPELRSIIII